MLRCHLVSRKTSAELCSCNLRSFVIASKSMIALLNILNFTIDIIIFVAVVVAVLDMYLLPLRSRFQYVLPPRVFYVIPTDIN